MQYHYFVSYTHQDLNTIAALPRPLNSSEQLPYPITHLEHIISLEVAIEARYKGQYPNSRPKIIILNFQLLRTEEEA